MLFPLSADDSMRYDVSHRLTRGAAQVLRNNVTFKSLCLCLSHREESSGVCSEGWICSSGMLRGLSWPWRGGSASTSPRWQNPMKGTEQHTQMPEKMKKNFVVKWDIQGLKIGSIVFWFLIIWSNYLDCVYRDLKISRFLLRWDPYYHENNFIHCTCKDLLTGWWQVVCKHSSVTSTVVIWDTDDEICSNQESPPGLGNDLALISEMGRGWQLSLRVPQEDSGTSRGTC